MKKVSSLISTVLIALIFSGCAPIFLKENAKSNNNAQPVARKNVATNTSQNKPDVVNATQISRYTTVKNGPTRAEVNPLMAVSTFKFPPSVYTVEQAVTQVLAMTGYQLAPHLSPQVKNTLREPIPITDRRLGPMTIRSALEVLMGKEVYDLKRDPLNRLINFKIKPAIAKGLGVKSDE